jgi:hypothetical protein
MAGKAATIYIVDQGASTGAHRNGRAESDVTISPGLTCLMIPKKSLPEAMRNTVPKY